METAYHLLFMSALLVPLVLFIIHLIRYRTQQGVQQGHSWSSVWHMAVMYVLAFNFVFFVQELFLAWGKNWLGLTSYLFHNNHDWEGSDPRTPLLQGSGALGILLFGMLMLLVHYWIRKKDLSIWVKALVLWLSLQGFAQFIPQVQTAFVATNTDVGQAMSYLGITGVTGFSLSLFVTGLMAVMMWLFLREFRALGLFDGTSKKAQMLSVLKIIALPAFMACFLIVPFRILPWDRGFMQFFSLMTWLPWFLLFAASKPSSQSKITFPTGMVWRAVISFLIMLLIFQLVLAPGVVFRS